MSSKVYRSLFRYLRTNSIHVSYRQNELKSYCTLESPIIPEKDDFKSTKHTWTDRYRGADKLPRGSPDVFGNLNNELLSEKVFDSMPEEEGDVIKHDYYFDKIGKKRLSTKQYADLIKKHVENNELLKALDILEVKMIKEDRVQPENYIYNLLIEACANVGYTKKAFKLYNDMKKRALKVTGATYTSLFNACALSRVHGDGLKRAHHLREIVIEKQVLLNRSNYHSMMKAFGRHGDLLTVFQLVDEMASKGIPLKADTFCFLLQACISDRENGFRHAILVWRKMIEKKVKPTIYCYNLMLRSARDCGVGINRELMEQLRITGSDKQDTKMIESGREDDESSLITSVNPTSLSVLPSEGLPNLLGPLPQMGSVISIRTMDKPKHRLMLLGGLPGVLKQMETDEILPDIKTATILLELLPSTSQAEQELLNNLAKYNVAPDIDFFNILINKRTSRNDYSSAKEVVKLISEHKLVPNFMTFGVLSLTCRNTRDALQLLSDVKTAGFRPDMEIYTGLVCAARHTWNPDLIMLIMDLVVEDDMKVSPAFCRHLEKFKEFNQQQFQLKEQGQQYFDRIDRPRYPEKFCRFVNKLKSWTKKIEMDDRDSWHPWRQYKKPTDIETNHDSVEAFSC